MEVRRTCYLSPACSIMLFTVFGSRSPQCFEIVTFPGFVGCLYWLCEPLAFLKYQPSSRIIFFNFPEPHSFTPCNHIITRIMRIVKRFSKKFFRISTSPPKIHRNFIRITMDFFINSQSIQQRMKKAQDHLIP